MKNPSTHTGNSTVAIVAIVAVAALAGGGLYLFSESDPSATTGGSTQSQDDSADFSFEYQDSDGEAVSIQGDSDEE